MENLTNNSSLASSVVNIHTVSRGILTGLTNQSVAWIVIGSFGMVASIFVIVVVLSSKEMRKKSIHHRNVLHLAVGYFIISIGVTCTGLKRLLLVVLDIDEVTTPIGCAPQVFFLAFGQIAPLTRTLAMTSTRLYAVWRPAQFCAANESASRWYLVDATFWVIGLVPTLVLVFNMNPGQVPACLQGFLFNADSWANYFYSVAKETLSTIVIVASGALAVTFWVRWYKNTGGIANREAGEREGNKTEVRVTKVCLLVAFNFVCFWLVPELVMLVGGATMAPGVMTAKILPNLPPTNAAAGVIDTGLYLVFDSTFRHRAMELIGLKAWINQVRVISLKSSSDD